MIPAAFFGARLNAPAPPRLDDDDDDDDDYDDDIVPSPPELAFVPPYSPKESNWE